ncbi:sialidase family protein [Pseudobythopirellula maris]|uniref:sialidase family protein n=1 Tax=Pseudobythopirellula maris TaxID=2527991 RepID=UPI0018D314C2|nr:sialidase family protein [Pseudobythopirellula maris]
MRRPLLLVVVLLTATAGLPLLAAAQEPSDALLLSEMIYEEAPYPSCHASTIEEIDGGLIAAWFGGTHERHPDVGIWVARKIDGAWSEPVEVANGVESPEVRYPTWNPVLFQPSEGPLQLFYKVGPTPRDWWGMVVTSDDNGQSWSEPRRLPDDCLGPIKNKPIERADGVVLCPSSHEGNDTGWRVHFEMTDAHAKSWRRTPYVNDGQEIRAIQPSLLDHGDGRLQALGRTRHSGIFTVWSEDGGETWGEMSLLDLPNPSSGTDAVTLADGRHLLVYNHNPNYKGRSPLNIALSENGVDWSAALMIEDNPEMGFAYPAVIQTDDGLVHVTYTWDRLRIKHVVIDPAKLTTTPIEGSQWPDSVTLSTPAGSHE